MPTTPASPQPSCWPPGPGLARARCRAFTLIELLVAMALGTLLVLITVQAFSTAGDAMAALRRLAEENRLIRAGYFTVIEEADFWHSHANPSYPYLRGHNVVGDGVRPFAPVTWNDDLTHPVNPNWPQPHDPRAWYRNHLSPGPIGGYHQMRMDHADPSQFTAMWDPDFRTYSPNALQAEQQTMRFFTGLPTDVTDPYKPYHLSGSASNIVIHGNDHRDLLPGWTFRHVVGDYAALANIDNWSRDADGDSSFDAADERSPDGYDERHDRSLLAIRAVEALGQYGLATYLPPGSLTLLQTASVNDTPGAVGSDDFRVRRGEIPWAGLPDLTTTVATNLSAPTTRSGTTRPATAAWGTLARSDYQRFMPTSSDILRASYKFGPNMSVATDIDTVIGEAYAITHAFVVDREDIFANLANSLARPLSPLGLIYPRGPQLVDWAALASDPANAWNDDAAALDRERPLVLLHPPDLSILGTDGSGVERQKKYRLGAEIRFHRHQPSIPIDEDTYYLDMRQRHAVTTWHVPLNHTGDPRPRLDEGAQGGQMATRIFRYRYKRMDKAECAIVITLPGEERSLELRFGLLTSDYRGARQYWGRVSAAAEPGVTADAGTTFSLGDHYGP